MATFKKDFKGNFSSTGSNQCIGLDGRDTPGTNRGVVEWLWELGGWPAHKMLKNTHGLNLIFKV